jgi:putative transposase
MRQTPRGAPTLGTIIGAYKSLVASRWLVWIKATRPEVSARIWQRNFYERVIRNDDELNRIREYIRLNPLRWIVDAENPDRRLDDAYEREWGWLEKPGSAHPL